uniref:Uncharacterized protein n=1 Tax=Rhizophora mucronata TaxID=61149 RepID=A0A2P2QB86_RHIMU
MTNKLGPGKDLRFVSHFVELLCYT